MNAIFSGIFIYVKTNIYMSLHNLQDSTLHYQNNVQRMAFHLVHQHEHTRRDPADKSLT